MQRLLVVWLVLALAAPSLAGGDPAEGPRPADPLLKLVPADAGLTLVIEDLKGQARALSDDPLAEAFRELPVVRQWLESGGRQRFQQVRAHVEQALGTTLERLRDDLLGEAVVLALRLEPGQPPDQARGLLLARVRDRALLDGVIGRLNDIETAEGTLLTVEKVAHGGLSYAVRRFAPGTKPAEAYVVLGDATFAWSNSEELIRGVIDRHQSQIEGGLASHPEFRAVRAALPASAVVGLYVDPRFLERTLGIGPPDEATDPTDALFRRYLAAVRYAGAALELRNGIFLDVREHLDPSGLDEPLRRWAAGSADGHEDDDDLLARIPAGVPALARAHVEARALADLLLALVPEAERPRIEPALTVLGGLLLGKDVRGAVLPLLGPGVVAYVSAPEAAEDGAWHLPFVVAVAVGGERDDPLGVPAALDNALRTLFAMAALDAPPGQVRVETTEREEVQVSALVGRRVPLAYALGPGFLVFGTSPDAVAAFAADPENRGTERSRFARVRAAHFPAASTFAYADLDALGVLARAHRDALVGRIARDQGGDEATVRGDLDRALALLGLFRAAFLTQQIAPDFSAVHRRVGLLATEPPAP